MPANLDWRESVGYVIGISVAFIIALYLVGSMGVGAVNVASSVPAIQKTINNTVQNIVGAFNSGSNILTIAIILALLTGVPVIGGLLYSIFSKGGETAG